MAYFPDLSFYDYFRAENHRGAKNIGWLGSGHEFQTGTSSELILDSLWVFCKASVLRSRGIHQCDLCTPPRTVRAERNGIELLLGTAEIRVFSKESDTSTLPEHIAGKESGGLLFLRRSPPPFSVYAAPTLIYHYVNTHHYRPPQEFLHALAEGPRPPDGAYFECLKKLELE
jgi:hypothetical protein